MPCRTLIIFDFSGTLSLDAVAFGAPETLMRHLAESGLVRYGIDSPGTYWKTIAGPSWSSAAVGPLGLTGAIVRQIEQRAGSIDRQGQIAAAAFTAAYLGACRVHAGWLDLLRALAREGAATVVIATDHYAEATAAIVSHLTDEGIPARALTRPAGTHTLWVANSADLGHLKAEMGFWAAVRAAVGPMDSGGILLVDDFGANETAGSDYSRSEAVPGRRKETAARLAAVFEAPPRIFQFFVSDPAAADAAVARSVATVTAFLKERRAMP